MKTKFLILAGLLAAAPVMARASGFSAAQGTWKEVRTGLQELDDLIAYKKLSEVHGAAFYLRDGVRALRFDSDALTPEAKNKLDGLIRQLDLLAKAMDESGDKNDLRATVAGQRKVHLLLDQIAAVFPANALPKVGPIVATGPVKDPVCRMTVMPATAPGRVAYGGQTYYFCSKGDAAAFQKSPAKYAALCEEIAFGKPKTYRLNLSHASQVQAGKPTVLSFAVREQGSGAVVKNFQVVHEKLMHLIVVRDDLSNFSHQHPQISPDGRFTLKTTFPSGGRYLLFGDFTPADGLNQVLGTELSVSGPRPGATRLIADTKLTKTVNGITVSVRPSALLEVGKPVLLTYSLSQHGKPLTDMQPYLGAMGHLMAINQNGRNILHTHTVSSGGNVAPAMATASGPRFTYEVKLAKGGLTKIWAQFQRNGRVLTVPFVFNVQENPMKISTKTLATLATGAALATSAAANSKATPKIPANAQKITVTLPAGYSNSTRTLKAGQPVALTFFLKSDAGCGNEVVFPAAHWKKTLKVGEKATVVYTPKKSGTLAFACGMNHLKGSLLVR